MKQLFLLRHANSSGGAASLADFDRPLIDQGREEATLIAEHLQTIGSVPDAIISSPALRAKQTAECLAAALNNAPALSFEKRLYEAPVEAILQAARSVSGDPAVLMLVGHNPSIHLAALKFSEAGDAGPQAALLRSYPAAGLASFRFGEMRWQDISWSDAVLGDFVAPELLRSAHSQL